MIHFYLNEIEFNVATNSAVTETQDSTLDNGYIELAFNDREKPFAPFTKFRIFDDITNESLNFIIIQDEVERVSKREQIFKHTLLVTQNTNELTTKQVRNSTFSQPSIKKRRIFLNCCGVCKVTDSVYDDRYIPFSKSTELDYRGETISRAFQYDNRLQLDDREKITGLVFGKAKVGACNIHKSGAGYTTNSDYYYDKFSAFNIILNLVDDSETIVDYIIGKVDIEGNITFNDYSKDDIITFFNRTKQGYSIKPCVDYFTDNRLRVDKINDTIEEDSIYKTLVVINIEINVEIYYYSLLDILEDLAIQDKQDTSDISNKKALPYTINSDSELYLVAKDFVAPNIVFTQMNLFECVSEVMRVIDGVPTLTKDNELDIEYLNDITKESVEASIENYKKSLSSEYFNNRLMTYFQNARKDEAEDYPSAKSYANVTPTHYGILGENDYEFEVAHKIDYVDDLYIKFTSNVARLYAFIQEDNRSINIRTEAPFGYISLSHNLYESSMSSLFKATSTNKVFPSAFNTLTYTRLSNKISIGTYEIIDSTQIKRNTLVLAFEWAINFAFGFVDYNNENSAKDTDYRAEITDSAYAVLEDRKNLKLRCKYHALTDGLTSVEKSDFKHEGDMMITSNSASVDSYRMGVSMLSNLAMLGNEKYVCTLAMNSFDKRLRKGSLWVDDDNNRYIANVVKTTFSTSSNKVLVNVEFIKNFNQIFANTQLFNEKRFYQIDNALTSKGYQLYTDYLYLTLDTANFSYTSKVCFNANVIKGMFFVNEDSYNIARSYFSSNTDLAKVNNITDRTYEYAHIPLHSYATGTTFNFEVAYENSVNARNRVVEEDYKIIGKSTLYVDETGFADYISLVYNFDNDYNTTERDFPLVSSGAVSSLNAIYLNNLHYLKRDNEIFALNYQICVLPFDKDIIVSDTLINRSSLIANSNKIKQMFIAISDLPYSIIDRKVNEVYCGCRLYSIETTNTGNGIVGSMIIVADRQLNARYFSIVDEDNNILIAFNSRIDYANSFYIHFFTSNKRINLNE